jgi:hypothetical protein
VLLINFPVKSINDISLSMFPLFIPFFDLCWSGAARPKGITPDSSIRDPPPTIFRGPHSALFLYFFSSPSVPSGLP